MFQVRSADEVINIIELNFSSYFMETEMVPLSEAAGRITAANIIAQEDIPGFDRSTVDGYAVRAADTFGASEALPAQLRFIGEVKMGEKPAFILQPGQTVYIPTGGELPAGADAVVMVEYSEDLKDGFIYLNKSAAPGNNVIFCGDDTRTGEVVIKENSDLTPRHIGLLAAIGCPAVKVRRRLKVGILSTGDEIVGIDEAVTGSQVRDVNSWFLHASISAYGATSFLYGIIKDNDEEIRSTVTKALDLCDIVLISGGSSVGTRDVTSCVIESLGEPGILVHGIAVKPGKPTIIGKVGHKAVVGLPGHPASAYMIYKVFVEYLMDRMSRVEDRRVLPVSAVISVNYPSNHGREEYLPVRLEQREGQCVAVPLFGKSGLMKMLAEADGYVRIPRESEGLAAGQRVGVVRF